MIAIVVTVQMQLMPLVKRQGLCAVGLLWLKSLCGCDVQIGPHRGGATFADWTASLGGKRSRQNLLTRSLVTLVSFYLRLL